MDRRARARRTPCQARPRSPTGSNARVNPRNRDWAADALKAVFSMESRDKALENAEFVAKDMESKKLREAAKCLGEAIGETTTYLLDDYPREHRRRIRTNNMIERLNREIRRRTRVVGSFPDGRSCLCSISCCGFSHDDFSGLGRACRPRNGLNWMVLVSPPERTGKDYDQHAPSTVYPSFAAERGIRRVDRAENTCQRADGA